MRTNRCHRSSWLILLIALLAGCSTPKPILNLAGQGTATVALAEESLRDYLAITSAQLTARTELMRLDAEQEVRDSNRREFELFLASQAGAPRNDEAVKKMQELGDERRRLREKTLEELKAREKEFSFDASTLPEVPAGKLAAARKSFEVLAQELTPEEWIKLAVAYAREIKTGVDKLREVKSEPTGTAPASPTVPSNGDAR